MNEFERRIGRRSLGNKAASGTEIIKELGAEHMRTGSPIVYTSADSVFQIAAHEEVIPLWELYKMCETAREILHGPHEVGRVIARPFIGAPGSFTRTSNRHDYAVPPPPGMLLDQLHDRGIAVHSVGKIFDVFLGRGIVDSSKTKNNADGMAKTLEAMQDTGARPDLRQPGRFRPAVRPSQRRGRLRRARSKSSMPGSPNSRAGWATAISPSSPPTTAATPLRPPPITAASTCRCWSSAPRCAPASIWACAARSAISARPSPRISVSTSRKGQAFYQQIL